MMKDKYKVPIIEDVTTLQFISQILYLCPIVTSLLTGSVILYSKVNSIKTNYRIKKDFAPRGGYIISISDEDKKKIDDFDTQKISKFNHSKEILHFIDVVRKNFNEEDLAFMVKNLNKLNVYNLALEDYFRTDGLKAYYNVFNNSIFLHEKNPENYVFHELFHAASAAGEDNAFCVGFANYSKSSFGVGINEGYTQLLTNRYFPCDKSYLFYPYLTKVASILEYIIGKDDMQSMYMRGELNLLFNKLSSFSSEQDALNFINILDNICSHLYKKGLNNESKVILNQSLYEINVLLTRFVINKYVMESDTSKLNLSSIYNKCLPVIHSLPANIECVHFKCNFWDDKIALDTISEELSLALNLNNTKRK